MPLIPQDVVDKLNRIPLTRVMEAHGYTASHRTQHEVFYCCPFHNEKDASFKVDVSEIASWKRKSRALPGFRCFGCNIKGYGALMLQAALMRKNLGKDFQTVAQELARMTAYQGGGVDGADPAVDALAKLGNVVINGEHRNGFFHRAQQTVPQNEFSFVPKDSFSHDDLRALGCQVQQLFRPNWGHEGRLEAVYAPTETIGKSTANPIETIGSIETIGTIKPVNAPLYKYSFGTDFYSPDCQGNNFDPRLLTERFNLYAISEFTTEKRWKADTQEWVSHRVVSTDTYPVFVFRYEDAQGWWCRKYEPYFKTTEKAKKNYKFTWWYQGGRRRDDEISRYMYGDVDVMRALAKQPVETSDAGHPTVKVVVKEDGNRITKKKFRRLVICSGPRDAINVYFHSDAHVCFPHSETVDISPSTICKLREIANEIYILYDIDETGRKRANRLAMRFLDLKVLYLPQDLMEIESPRTGKPCKDAEEYFNYYPVKLNGISSFFGESINAHFANMLEKSKPMMFWKQKDHIRNKNTENEFVEPSFTLRIGRMNQFLSANGMCKYEQGKGKTFAKVGEDKIVDIMDEKQGFLCAKTILKDYLDNNKYYYNEDLSDAISDSKKLNLSTLQEIGGLNLDFHSWDEDFDYFFFKDEAVRVTKDGVECVPYDKMPYHTNREAIMQDVEFYPIDMSQYFEIQPNKDIPKIELEYKRRYDEADTAEEKDHIQAEMESYKQLWGFKLILKKPMKEMPSVIQFVYDLGRVWWKDEEAGLTLTPEKRQFQDMHFINKIVGLGYMLSRYRTDLRQQMVVLTDYHQTKEGKGRTGKTTFMRLLGLVRKGLDKLPGKQFMTATDKFAQNFSEFTQTKHFYVSIDDLDANLNDNVFYNSVQQIQVKNLYHDYSRIPEDESPKIIATTNFQFDITASSTIGRMWPMYACDYYHGKGGGRTEFAPKTKFGYNIVKGKNEEELNLNRNLVIYALQLYFQFLSTGSQDVIYPPVDNEAQLRMVAKSCQIAMFTEWFSMYFLSGNPWRYERPIHLDEMAISYMEYRDSLKEKKEPITKAAVEALKKSLKPAIKQYCEMLNITVNPSVVFSGSDSQERDRRRVVAWKTLFDENGRIKEPRQRIKAKVGCWYFYRKGDEPKTKDQILDAPDEDMETKWEQGE